MKTFHTLAKPALLALMFCLMPQALAYFTETVNGVEWRYNVNDGKVRIGDSYRENITAIPNTTKGAITIPSKLGGYPVTSIYMAFFDCTGLTHVTIPGSVTNITSAFSGCTGLTHMTIPASVTRIGYDAFRGCSGLTSVVIPDSVTSIGTYAFSGCYGLTNVLFKGAPPPNVGGFAFTNIARNARGYYTAAHAAEWEAAIGSDGKWNGLIMQELSQSVLRVESADPAAGSLKLAWDESMEGNGITYSVWRGTGGERKDAVCVTNGLTATTWTDTNYWSAEPVGKPLNYWVTAEGSEFGEWESNPVETRYRHGVFVGVGAYNPSKFPNTPPNQSCIDDATLFRNLFVGRGWCPDANAKLRTTPDDTKVQAIRGAMRELAASATNGDFAIVYIHTHGFEDGGLQGYDGYYTAKMFAEDLRAIPAGVSVFCVLGACHSEAMFGAERDNPWTETYLHTCPSNVAFLSSASWDETSLGNWFTTESGQKLSELATFLLYFGWDGGFADTARKDGIVTLEEATRYAGNMVHGMSDNMKPSHAVSQVPKGMRGIPLGTAGAQSWGGAVSAPRDLTASEGARTDGVELAWAEEKNAFGYHIYRAPYEDGLPIPDAGEFECIQYWYGGETFFDDLFTAYSTHCIYYVVAASPAGTSKPSNFATGFPKSKRRGEGGWVYAEDDGEATVTRMTSAEGAATVPSSLGGASVTGIGSCAFYGTTNLTSVTIPESVTNVGIAAFAGCTGLATLYVPASWEGTDMLSGAGVPESCRIVYGMSFAVELDAQGGTGGTESVTATYGCALPAISVPQRAGFTFQGYFAETGGKGTQYYGFDGKSAANWNKAAAATLYAHWTETVLHVDAVSGNDANDGLSWATAKASIQAAINAAEDGVRILVGDGVYGPIDTVNSLGNAGGKQLEIIAANGAEKTVIDASSSGANRAAFLGRSDNYTGKAEGPQSVLEGFTIRGARQSPDMPVVGAGVCGGILRRCIVTDNQTQAAGGGVAYAVCESCTISGNKSTRRFAGGAYFCTLTDCIVEGNEAAENGGGTVGGRLVRCIVRNNKAAQYGGGFTGGDAEDCLFAGNEAKLGGGAVAGANLSRCTVVSNRTEGTGGGAIGSVLHGSIVWGNTAGEADDNCNTSNGNYTDTLPALPGRGNISANPLFLDAASGDYRLSPGSPCIDTGFGPTGTGRKDLSGGQRWQGARMDMGAYEAASSSPAPAFAVVDLWVDAANGNDANAGTARDKALASIGAAAEKAADGATIHVLPGTYAPFSLDGRTLTVQSTDGAEKTIVSGGGTARCAWLGTDSASVLAGLTLCDGYVPMDGGGVWGGTLRDCIIRDNTAGERGGGAVLARLERCRVHGNSAVTGSGGGTVSCDLSDCLVYRNSAVSGGGIRSDGHAVVNCTVAENSATQRGGGILSAGYVTNCIVWGNSAPDSPDLWGCDTWHVCSPDAGSENGNIAADPLFVDALSGDFRLRAGSPCIDAGADDCVQGDADLDGNVRIFGGAVDIGAYEHGSGLRVRLDPQGGSGGTDSVIAVRGKPMPEIAKPTRAGYAFGGYFTEPGGKGTQYYAASGASARNWDGTSATTLHAKWISTALPVYRFYSQASKGHFFTISEAEKNNLIANNSNWRYERVAYRAFTNQVAGTVPLYRFYSQKYKGHFYTISESEKNNLIATSSNWKYERIAYYVHPSQAAETVPVYRFWSQTYGHHFYTTSEAEKDNLIATNPNWKYETVAFWALPPESGAGTGWTMGSPVPVPHSWLKEKAAEILSANGGDCEAAAEAKAANGVNTVWECYVAGLDPTDAEAAFKVEVAFMDGKPVVSSDPDLGDERMYTVEGAENLGGAWGPTNAATRFFRVKVSLPE